MSIRSSATTLDVPRSTVADFCHHYLERCGDKENKRPTGRPPKLNKGGKRRLQLLVKHGAAGRRSTLAEFTNPYNSGLPLKTQISECTVRRSLHDTDFRSQIAIRKPFVTKKQAMVWRFFAQKRKAHNDRFWFRVVWTDDASFELNKHGRVRVWREPGEAALRECMKPTFRSGCVSILVWGCFIGGFKGPVVFWDAPKKNSAAFVELLKKPELASFSQDPQVILQMDNPPIRTSKMTRNFLGTQEYNMMVWPAQSPDLNPIENVWAYVKHTLKQKFLHSREELGAAIQEAWDAAPAGHC